MNKNKSQEAKNAPEPTDLGHAMTRILRLVALGESAYSINNRLQLLGFSEEDATALGQAARTAFIKLHAVDHEVHAASTLSELSALFRQFLKLGDQRGALEALRLKCRVLEVGDHLPVERERGLRRPSTQLERDLEAMSPADRELLRGEVGALVREHANRASLRKGIADVGANGCAPPSRLSVTPND